MRAPVRTTRDAQGAPGRETPGRIPVLEFLTNFQFGGTERNVLNLVRHLDRERFAVHLACFERVGPLLAELDGSDVAVSEYRISKLLSLHTLRQQARLVDYVRAHRIEVVHAYGFYPNVFALPAARLGGVAATVAGIRDTLDHLTPPKRRLLRSVCALAGGVLVNSDAVERRLVADGYDRGRISVIRNGLDVRAIRSRGKAPHVRRELGLPPGAPIVAMLSRISEIKGIEYFVEAAHLLAPRFPDARFVLAGDSAGPEASGYRAFLESRAGRLGLEGRFLFAGYRADVFELLSEVAVSVLPSLSEGLPNALIESMAASVPVVATRVGGNPEIVEDGVSGLLVPPRDAVALAQAIGLLLEDEPLARSMAQYGRKMVEAQFSLPRMVRQTEALYESLLRAHEARPAAPRIDGARA